MNFKDFLHEKSKIQPTELKELIAQKAKLGDYWHDKILVQGKVLFDIYMDFLGWMEKNADDLSYASWIEDVDGYPETITRELQESYLGYVPSKDIFITGYDMWEGDDNPAGVAIWKIKNGKGVLISEDIKYGSDMMYGSRGEYKKLHNKYKDLQDIRLD